MSNLMVIKKSLIDNLNEAIEVDLVSDAEVVNEDNLIFF